MRSDFLSVLLLLSLAVVSAEATSARGLLAGSTCDALTTTSLQLKGQALKTVRLPSSASCCQACALLQGCQMWWFNNNQLGRTEYDCEMFSLDQGPVTWSIMYRSSAGLMTQGPSPLVEASNDCDGHVWLFKDVLLDGVVKAAAMDPYAAEAGFRNKFSANTWQDCCRAARNAPGTTLMERAYQYRARQYWTWQMAEKTCVVHVRPFLIGATVLTVKRVPSVVSGMFGNEP